MYLDEGEPMREALLALLTSHSRSSRFSPPRPTSHGCWRPSSRRSKARAGPWRQVPHVHICPGGIPHPKGAGSLAPAGRRGLQSGHRPDPGDLAGHRQKTRQQPARQAGRHQPHPGDCPGTCPLTALEPDSLKSPTGHPRPSQTTPFGRPLTTVERRASCYTFRENRSVRKPRRRPMHYRIRVQGHLDPGWQDRFRGITH